jgi:hypothetical protein
VIDPARGPVVTQIFAWRAMERLSFRHVAARLNTDLDRYPPPAPMRREAYHAAIGAWTATAVRDLLDNPKHTGHMVWNRRKRYRPERGVKGRVNPPSQWLWSPQPTHEPLTTRAFFDAASRVPGWPTRRRGSKRTPTVRRARIRETPWRFPGRVQVFLKDQEQSYFRLYMFRDGAWNQCAPAPPPDADDQHAW